MLARLSVLQVNVHFEMCIGSSFFFFFSFSLSKFAKKFLNVFLA